MMNDTSDLTKSLLGGGAADLEGGASSDSRPEQRMARNETGSIAKGNTFAAYPQIGQSIFDEEIGDSSSSQPEPASTSSHLIQGADSSQQSSEPSVLASVFGVLMALGIFGLGIGDVLLKKGIYEDLRKHYPRKQRFLFNAYDWFDVLTIATLFLLATYQIAFVVLMRHKKLTKTSKANREKDLELELVKREKAQVTDGMTALKEQIAALEQHKVALKQNNAALNAKIENLAKEVGNKNEAMSLLEEEVEIKNSENVTLVNKNESLRKENETSKKEHESLRELFRSLQEDFQTARDVVSLKGSKSQLESELAGLNQKLKSEQEIHRRTVLAKKDAFEAKVLIEADIEACELKKRGLTGEVEALKQKIEALDQEKEAKFQTNQIIKDDRALGRVEAKLPEARSELARVQARITCAGAALDDLQGKFAAKTEEIDGLQSRHEKLSKSVKDTELREKFLMEEIGHLELEAQGQEGANEKLEAMNAKVTKERIEVHQSCQKLEKDRKQLEEEKREFSAHMLEKTRELEELKTQQDAMRIAEVRMSQMTDDIVARVSSPPRSQVGGSMSAATSDADENSSAEVGAGHSTPVKASPQRIAEDRMSQMKDDIVAYVSSPPRSQVGGSMSAATSDADENSSAEVGAGHSTPVKASPQDFFKIASSVDSPQSPSHKGEGSSQKQTGGPHKISRNEWEAVATGSSSSNSGGSLSHR